MKRYNLEPRPIFRYLFIAAIAAVIALLLSEAVRACDYTPDPVTIPPTIELLQHLPGSEGEEENLPACEEAAWPSEYTGVDLYLMGRL